MAIDSLMQIFLLSYSLRESIFREMIGALQLPHGSRGLDAGCGIGLQCTLLAEAVGHSGNIVGLDLSSEMLIHAKDLMNKAGLSARVSFKKGDINHLPFEDNTFDWAWSVDCVGYAPVDPLRLMKELVRVVKPGGMVAIAAWSSEQLLPGYPRLEARLRATADGIAPFVHGKEPGSHFLRALGWFHELGFTEAVGEVFANSVCAPLEDIKRDALADLFSMRWPNAASELTGNDLAEFQRLCIPESPDFILNLSDYYALFTYSMFRGKTAQ